MKDKASKDGQGIICKEELKSESNTSEVIAKFGKLHLAFIKNIFFLFWFQLLGGCS